jgi:phospholipase C
MMENRSFDHFLGFVAGAGVLRRAARRPADGADDR